jgi:hypothetical protein
METHLALLGWVPFRWGQAAAHNPSWHDIVVWVNFAPDDAGDWFGWTRNSVFPTPDFDEIKEWPKDDALFWQLAKGLTEDERFK